ncbi:DinB family protein [Olivibacter sitiensis]|uniref:DinB family protein n=1 Tax=Olivibacter sitiensis TaxID=376470 RepID=UPI0003FA0EA5|nr:DinB family protein [Olivibacter sitiensis]
MKETFKYIIRTRELFIALLDTLSIEQINEIPQGFRNNVGWNFGHIVVSTPGLCYLRTGVKYAPADVPFLADYRKGSKPEKWIESAEIEALKQYAFSWISQIEEDLGNGVFAEMKPFATDTYGYEMTSIEEIVTCSLAHDNMHYGYALAQRRALKK